MLANLFQKRGQSTITEPIPLETNQLYPFIAVQQSFKMGQAFWGYFVVLQLQILNLWINQTAAQNFKPEISYQIILQIYFFQLIIIFEILADFHNKFVFYHLPLQLETLQPSGLELLQNLLLVSLVIIISQICFVLSQTHLPLPIIFYRLLFNFEAFVFSLTAVVYTYVLLPYCQ